MLECCRSAKLIQTLSSLMVVVVLGGGCLKSEGVAAVVAGLQGRDDPS